MTVGLLALVAPVLADLPSSIPPRLLHAVPAPYPIDLRKAGKSGIVEVDFIVDRRGVPWQTFAVAAGGGREFEASAVRAVSQWRFSPGMKQGHPVNTHLRVPVQFAIGPQLPEMAVRQIEDIADFIEKQLAADPSAPPSAQVVRFLRPILVEEKAASLYASSTPDADETVKGIVVRLNLHLARERIDPHILLFTLVNGPLLFAVPVRS